MTDELSRPNTKTDVIDSDAAMDVLRDTAEKLRSMGWAVVMTPQIVVDRPGEPAPDVEIGVALYVASTEAAAAAVHAVSALGLGAATNPDGFKDFQALQAGLLAVQATERAKKTTSDT